MTKRGSHLVMVLPDLHVPHQDEAALSCVLRVHRKLQPRRTVILGDWLEAAAFSSHPPKSLDDARAHDFMRDEVAPCNAILDKLEANTREIAYIEGNHEDRVTRMCANGGPLASVHDLIAPEYLLGRGRKRFTWVPYSRSLSHYKIADDLIAFHGWSHAKQAASVHASLLKGVSGVHGHTHRAQEWIDRDPLTDRVQIVWSPGCLRDLQPNFMAHKPSGWVHGFSLVYVRNDLTRWTHYTVLIDRGQCVLPDGSQVRG